MEIPLLTIDDQIAGRIEPDLDSFSIQGLDEVWMMVPKRFIITALAKNAVVGASLGGAGSSTAPLGGAWSARIAFNIEGSISTPVEVIRMGPDGAYFDYTFSLQGLWKIWLDVSSIPVKGSPFTVNVHWGSASQISKWQSIGAFLKGDVENITQASLGYSEILYAEAANRLDYQALDYRGHILSHANALPLEKSTEIIARVNRTVLVRRLGSILDDFPDIQAIFVSHNSWMEWPKESGYQSRLLARLSEKERKNLLDRSTTFGRSRLDYGSSLVFSAVNIAPPNQPIQPKTLINTVTVIFRTKEKLTRNSFVHTKPENLRRALHLGLIEAEAKGVTSIVIPSSISKNYFAGGKNDECIITSIKEWITNNPSSAIHTIVISEKDPTPKVARKKRFGSLHRRPSGGGGGGGSSGSLPIPDFRS